MGMPLTGGTADRARGGSSDDRRQRIRAVPHAPPAADVLTHFLMTVSAAGLAVVLLLAFYSPGPGGSGGSFPGSGAVPAPATSAAR
jgi:hypothetical protein